jgi:hypothetical protein
VVVFTVGLSFALGLWRPLKSALVTVILVAGSVLGVMVVLILRLNASLNTVRPSRGTSLIFFSRLCVTEGKRVVMMKFDFQSERKRAKFMNKPISRNDDRWLHRG